MNGDTPKKVESMEIPGIQLIEKVGQGGMSEVWKGWDSISGRMVAVKLLDPELGTKGEEVRSFIMEEQMMESVRHEGIVQAYLTSYANGRWYIIMEYVDGYTFSALLQRKRHIPELDCLLIAESVAAALDYAWNDHGIVHCDIKPENIMINTDGVIKLTDLGISHQFQFLEDSQQAVPDHITGTPAYISPEQVYGDVELDCRADIYSLGATLYHLATGRCLFPDYNDDASLRAHCNESVQAKDPRYYRPELSRGFVQMLEAMLVKNRDGRLRDWREVFATAQAVERGAQLPERVTGGNSSLLMSTYG